MAKAALTTFAATVYANKSRLRRIWLVSPWIGGSAGKTDPISYLVEALRNSDCNASVVTRKPAADSCRGFRRMPSWFSAMTRF